MAQETKVVRNRVSIDGRIYEVKALGGGKFDVYNHNQLRVGGFAIVARELSAEDRGVDGADPVELIGLSWAKANLSLPIEAKRAPEPPPQPVAPVAPPPIAPAPIAPAPIATPLTTPIAVTRHVPAPADSQRRADERASIVDDQEVARGRESDPDQEDALELDAGLGELAQGPIPLAKGILRIATHDKPDLLSLQKAQNFLAWLRKQPGVLSAFLSHDPKTGRTISMTVWESREALAAIRKAQVPRNAVQLRSSTVELLWLVG